MPTSASLFKRAQRVLVGGVNSPVRAFKAVGGVPRFVRKASGSRLIDVEGRGYVDYCLSWGPLILGHARREVVAAAAKALKSGSTFGASTEGEIRLAEEIREAIPSMERVRLTSSGTEAVMSALRLARACTGRDMVVKFAGGYHGHVDSLLVAAGSGAATLGTPDSAGVPQAWAGTTITLPYNDAELVRKAFRQWSGLIAAVIVEPVAANMGVINPKEGFLQTLRDVTRENGALLIFDEVVTGFRLCYGGAQTLWGIDADLTTLGKIVGGGLPLAAYGGRAEIMERVAPLGPVYQAGTLSGNPVAVAAGLETLRILRYEKPYWRLSQITDNLVDGLRDEARKAGLLIQIHAAASMLTVFFCATPIYDYQTAKAADTEKFARFFQRMLAQGVYWPPAQLEAAFLSTAHRDADLERTIKAAGRAFRR